MGSPSGSPFNLRGLLEQLSEGGMQQPGYGLEAGALGAQAKAAVPSLVLLTLAWDCT